MFLLFESTYLLPGSLWCLTDMAWVQCFALQKHSENLACTWSGRSSPCHRLQQKFTGLMLKPSSSSILEFSRIRSVSAVSRPLELSSSVRYGNWSPCNAAILRCSNNFFHANKLHSLQHCQKFQDPGIFTTLHQMPKWDAKSERIL